MELSLGEIITFYSYKGGTGRSMALANTACLLAQRQDFVQGVLMIDWDLEAPGLHQFFQGRFDNNENGQEDLPIGQLGLIDLFYEIRKQLEDSKIQDNSSVSEDIFSEIDIQKYIVKMKLPSLFFMPAGRFDDGLYSSRVNEFNWSDFFNKFPLVITQFAQYLRKKYKYVFIDSRTGYTDISGICTSIMPEKLVAIFTPNKQSLSGIVEMIQRATNYRKQSDDLRPLMIFPLPSRIENAEGELQKEWRFGNSKHEGYQTQLESALMQAYGLQECDLTDYFDEFQLQYVPKYSYGEELAVLSERSEDRLSLARSFENFSERIISSENPWEDIRTLDESDYKDRPLQVFINYVASDLSVVTDLYNSLKYTGVDFWFDRVSLLPGQKWREEISKAIRKSDVMLVCLSKKAVNKNGHVQKEIAFALDKAKEKSAGNMYIIPVRIEKCNIPDSLVEYQWVDLFENDGYDILMRSLHTYAQKLNLSLPWTKLNESPVTKRQSVFIERRLAKVELIKKQKKSSP